MSEAAVPVRDEDVRLAAFRHLDPVAATGDPMLQRIASVAARVTGARHAGLHFIDRDCQHRVAAFEAPLELWPRADSMCAVVVEEREAIEVGDATEDERFSHSSFVTGEHAVRYYASFPLRGDGGQVIGTICVWDEVARAPSPGTLATLEDLAALVVGRLESLRANHILAEAAMTDPLTGLANRRMFNDAVDRALAAAQRREAEVAVLYLDLDRFKAINDDHGHELGDLVLQTVAKRLGDEWRADEVVARLGGDEFVVLLGDASAASAERAAVRIGEIVSQKIESPVGRLSVEASVGIAFASDDETGDALVRRADLAMYAAKAERRRAREE